MKDSMKIGLKRRQVRTHEGTKTPLLCYYTFKFNILKVIPPLQIKWDDVSFSYWSRQKEDIVSWCRHDRQDERKISKKSERKKKKMNYFLRPILYLFFLPTTRFLFYFTFFLKEKKGREREREKIKKKTDNK